MQTAYHESNWYALGLAQDYTLKEMSVEKACIQMGIKMECQEVTTTEFIEYEKDSNRKIPKKALPDIARMYFKENIGLTEIAQMYGVTRCCISKNLKKGGYEIYSKPGRKVIPLKISKTEYIKFKKKGLIDKQIMVIAGCTRATLTKYRKEWGLA